MTEMTKRTIRTEMTGSAVLLACASLFCLFCRFGLLPESDGFVTIYRERGDGTINGTINGLIKSELVEHLTHNEELVLSIVGANPGCKRELIISKMTCSARTADRCIATLAAIGRLELRGSKKTGGYYLIEKS